MEIHKVYCDMCKREIDITKEPKHVLEITKPQSIIILKEGNFDLCTECKDALVDLLKGDSANGVK